MTSPEAKAYVSRVRAFYEDLIYYGFVILICIVVWFLIPNDWNFWPGWVVLAWGLSFLRRALTLDLFSFKNYQKVFPFMSREWEERQIQKLTKKAEKADKA